MVTVDDYKKAILATYATAKEGGYAEYLLQPTPARFKKLSLLLLNENAADAEIYNRFFLFKEGEPQFKQIEFFDTDKFKPLSNFVKGKSELTNPNSLDLLAVLVGFNPRPYSKFRKSNAGPAGDGEVSAGVLEDAPLNSTLPVVSGRGSTDVVNGVTESAVLKNSTTASWYSRIVVLNNNSLLQNMLAVALCVAVVFAVKNTFFNEPGCMAWQGDHYEEVPCTVQQNTFTSTAVVVPMDKETFAFQKKMEVCDTTTFFLPNGLPRVWYCKTGEGKIEYFSYPGLHPVTGKTLKKITPYMINKYVKHKRQ